jgi:uncharacterized Tic20 family protein
MTTSAPGLVDIDPIIEDGYAQVRNADEKGMAVTMHVVTLAAQILTGGLLHVFVPAVSLVLMHNKSAWLKRHVKEQLNFQLTFLAASLVGGLIAFFTLGIGLIVVAPILVILFVADIVCSIQAALRASRGQDYQFPFSIRIVS